MVLAEVRALTTCGLEDFSPIEMATCQETVFTQITGSISRSSKDKLVNTARCVRPGESKKVRLATDLGPAVAINFGPAVAVR